MAENQSDYASQWEAIVSIAGKVGVSTESLRGWVRQAETDAGPGAFQDHMRLRILKDRSMKRVAHLVVSDG